MIENNSISVPIVFIFLISILAVSCSLVSNTYVHNTPNVQTCDSCRLIASGGIGFKHFETSLNLPLSSNYSIQSNALIKSSGFFWEFGGGMYRKTIGSELKPMLFCTYGLGRLEDSGYSDWSELTWKYSVNYQRLKLVPAIKIPLSTVDFSIGVSIAGIRYSQYNFEFIDENSHGLSDRSTVSDTLQLHNISGLIMSPFWTFDFPYQNNFSFKLNFAYSWVNFSGFDNHKANFGDITLSKEYPYFFRFYFSVGLSYKIRSF